MPNEIGTIEGAVLSPEAMIEEVRRGYLSGELEVSAASMNVVQVGMMAFSMQNLAVLDRTCNFIDSLLHTLPKDLGEDDPEWHLAHWVRNACHLVTEAVRTIRALGSSDYDAVPRHAAEVMTLASQASRHWNVLVAVEPDLQSNPGVSLMVGALEKLPFLARLLEQQADADRKLLEGNRLAYVERMEHVQDAMARERRQPQNLNDRFAPLFHGLLATLTDSVRARLDFVRRSLQDQGIQRVVPPGRKVFIIHGHDEGAWRELRDMLQSDEFKLDAVVLKEQAGATLTLIEKFERTALDCALAIALVTPDDMVKKAGKSSWQARPNVLFELGWFYGRLGPKRLLVLKRGEDTALPSDLGGILTLDFSKSVKETLASLRDELRAAGLLPASSITTSVRRRTRA